MGASNHPTVVPDDGRATALDGVQNDLADLDNNVLMRKFATSYSQQHHAGRNGGLMRSAFTRALAEELGRRDISGRHALNRYNVDVVDD